jgi:hypothetical protein
VRSDGSAADQAGESCGKEQCIQLILHVQLTSRWGWAGYDVRRLLHAELPFGDAAVFVHEP